jgi:hypothetical protein
MCVYHLCIYIHGHPHTPPHTPTHRHTGPDDYALFVDLSAVFPDKINSAEHNNADLVRTATVTESIHTLSLLLFTRDIENANRVCVFVCVLYACECVWMTDADDNLTYSHFPSLTYTNAHTHTHTHTQEASEEAAAKASASGTPSTAASTAATGVVDRFAPTPSPSPRYVCLCMRVCVCESVNAYIYLHTRKYTHTAPSTSQHRSERCVCFRRHTHSSWCVDQRRGASRRCRRRWYAV